MVGAPRVEAVEQALVAAGPALGHEAGHDRARPEGDVLGLAGEAEEHGAAGLGVDARELDAVGAQAGAPGAAVAPEQEDVVAAVDGSRPPHRCRRPRSSPRGPLPTLMPAYAAPPGRTRSSTRSAEQPPPVPLRQPVGAPQPPRVDEEHRPEHREAQERDLEHRQRPPVGEHGERGRTAHEGEEADEQRRAEQPEPDPQREAAQPRLPAASWAVPEDHGEQQQVTASRRLPPGARAPGVDPDGALDRRRSSTAEPR